MDITGIHDLQLHYHENSLYRVEVPTLRLAIHSQTNCTSAITNCYGANAIFDPAGLLIEPSNYTEISALTHRDVLSPNMRNLSTTWSNKGSPVARFVTESSDIMTEKLQNITSDIQFVECQLQSLLTTLFSLMSKQYPGETLTTLTGKKRTAITVGDVLTEISCQQVEGIIIILQTLIHDNQFSSRPLYNIS